MTGLFSALIDYMEEENWKYEILEGETIIRFHFKGSAGRMLCYGEVDEKKNWLLFYSYMPVNTPPDKLGEMAEFITRANRGMRIGNFELDYDDGEIRYKTSIDVEGGTLATKMIDNLLRANLSTINRYFDGVMGVIYSDHSSEDLIKQIEAPPTAEEFDLDDAEDEDDIDDKFTSEGEDDDEEEEHRRF